MNTLIWIAIALIIIWVIASLTKFLAGAMLHFLWIAALILLVIWVVRKIF